MKPAEPRFHIVLVEPQIPQNTGNIGRLALATGARLHLIEPLGFDISEKAVRRSGLDYWKHVDLEIHKSFAEFRNSRAPAERLWFFTKFAQKGLYSARFTQGDYLVFGKETTGLAQSIHDSENHDFFLKIPMFSDKVRSLNLANSASIAIYEAIRQTE